MDYIEIYSEDEEDFEFPPIDEDDDNGWYFPIDEDDDDFIGWD